MRSFVRHVLQDAPESEALLLSRLAAIDAENECIRLDNTRLRAENLRVQEEMDRLRERSNMLYETLRTLHTMCQDETIFNEN